MRKPLVRVQVRAVAVVEGGCALFIGNEEKVFGLAIERAVGAAIARFLLGTSTPRPSTHEFIATVLCGLEAKVERVIIDECKREAYGARLISRRAVDGYLVARFALASPWHLSPSELAVRAQSLLGPGSPSPAVLVQQT